MSEPPNLTFCRLWGVLKGSSLSWLSPASHAPGTHVSPCHTALLYLNSSVITLQTPPALGQMTEAHFCQLNTKHENLSYKTGSISRLASGRAGSRCLNSLVRHLSVSVSTSALLSNSFVLKQVLSSAVQGGPQPPTPQVRDQKWRGRATCLNSFHKRPKVLSLEPHLGRISLNQEWGLRWFS